MRIIIKKTGQIRPQDISFITTENASQHIKTLKMNPDEVINFISFEILKINKKSVQLIQHSSHQKVKNE